MKEIQPLEQFRFSTGVRYWNERDIKLAAMINAALDAMQIIYSYRTIITGGFEHREYTFIVDVREAAVICDIFDRMDNKLL